MNVIPLLLLGSLSLILVSALEAPSSQGVLAQTRLARDTNDSKKERRIKRRKSRRKKSNGKKDKEAKSRDKSRRRKEGRKALKRNKDMKKKSKNNRHEFHHVCLNGVIARWSGCKFLCIPHQKTINNSKYKIRVSGG